MSEPGAETSGFISPVMGEGPLLLNEDTPSASVVAPIPKASGELAGDPTVPGLGPAFPLANMGKMPSDTQFCIAGRKVSDDPLSLPQELLTTSGASSVLGSPSGSTI